MALRWYAARTRRLAEYTVRDRLEFAGCEVFLPCVGAVRPRRGRNDAPLFPGYLFLHYDLDEVGWQILDQVPQLVGLVTFGGVAPPMPDEVIGELRERVEGINGSGGLWKRFRPGDRVRIAFGPVESLAEVVEEAKSPTARVRVLLDFMGGLVPAQVHYENLAPIGDEGNKIPRVPRRTRGKGRWIQGFGPRTVASI